MKKVSVNNFRSDPMFPRNERAVADRLAEGNVVAPVDVLVGMRLLRTDVWPTNLDTDSLEFAARDYQGKLATRIVSVSFTLRKVRRPDRLNHKQWRNPHAIVHVPY